MSKTTHHSSHSESYPEPLNVRHTSHATFCLKNKSPSPRP